MTPFCLTCRFTREFSKSLITGLDLTPDLLAFIFSPLKLWTQFIGELNDLPRPVRKDGAIRNERAIGRNYSVTDMVIDVPWQGVGFKRPHDEIP